MSQPISPAVAEWELATRLRNRRHELGLDGRTVSQHLGFSPNYWSAVENGRSILSRAKLVELGVLFGFAESDLEELTRLENEARRPRWWVAYDRILDDDLMHLVGLEYGAARIQAYEALLVTGLLQTPAYSEALMTADPVVSPASTRLRLQLREQRQRRLFDDDPLELEVLLSEAALMQEIGGSRVLREQLIHVASIIEAREQHRPEGHPLLVVTLGLGRKLDSAVA